MSADGVVRVDLEALKRESSLVAVVTDHGVALRQVRPGQWTGRCPFHDDHTPSLLVDERDGHFHCFGCAAHGDVINFVMRAHGIGFRDALAHLLGSPSRPIAPHPRSPDPQRRWDQRTLEEQQTMNLAAAIYQRRLWDTPRALAYVRSRRLPDRLILRARLGYADGRSLRAWLERHGGLECARSLGLLDRQGRERLAGRVVVPELRGGQCVWFIGRAVATTPGWPPYLALPGERPVLGLEYATGRREVYLCEGVFDYLTARAWRLPACATCGTFLRPERLGFLALAEVVYGVFDGDPAGREAGARFGAVLGDRWRPVHLPDGLDLNDLGCQPDGHAVFRRLVDESRLTSGKECTNASTIRSRA